MDKDGFVFQRLLTFMEYKESKGRRMSVIATIHNCCFEKGNLKFKPSLVAIFYIFLK